MALASSSRFLPSNLLAEALVSYSNPHNHSGSLPEPKQWRPFVAMYLYGSIVLAWCFPIVWKTLLSNFTWNSNVTIHPFSITGSIPVALVGKVEPGQVSSSWQGQNGETTTNNHTCGLTSFWTGSMEICIFCLSVCFSVVLRWRSWTLMTFIVLDV